MDSISIRNRNCVSIIIDKADLRLLTQHKNGHWCFTVDNWGYANINYKRTLDLESKKVNLHKLVMGSPKGMDVDHINRNKLDNRRKNLRLCTRSESRMNGAGRGISLFKRVYRDGEFWASQIRTNGITTHLGKFDTEIEAALAYDAAAKTGR